ncbi:hypothetical protein ZHAS_00020355 [Anopheles sinensis]|uniref:Uncharacterized protein n=1 Tax=Anopheles sinensis TaxID=74873 RepID=A0A084WPU7_ANOSI|nr:hypothetical protein ZHAS_00020355 [Anopheles sinensis]
MDALHSDTEQTNESWEDVMPRTSPSSHPTTANTHAHTQTYTQAAAVSGAGGALMELAGSLAAE